MDKIDLLSKMVVVADYCDENGFEKEAIVIDGMIVKIGMLRKEAAPIKKYINMLKNLPVWAKEMWPVLREVWSAVVKMKSNLHLAKEATELGAIGMNDLKKMNFVKWRQLWDGLIAYQDALRSLRQSREKLVGFLSHDNEYIVNYAESLIRGVDDFLIGHIDDIEEILELIEY